MPISENERLSIARFQHFSKRILAEEPAQGKAVLVALKDLERNYFDKITEDEATTREHETLIEAHTELKHLVAIASARYEYDLNSTDLDPAASDKLENFEARHEAPISMVEVTKKSQHQALTEMLDSEDIQNSRRTTSANEISSLMQSQKLISSLELEDERKLHAAAVDRMATLTELLKETTLEMNRNIVAQNKDLDLIQQHATDNLTELDEQRKLLNTQSKSMAMGFWMGIYAYVFILLMFLFTYLVIRLFPANPHY